MTAAPSEHTGAGAETMKIQGTSVPRLGFGTWQLYGKDAAEAVRDALEIGYRHIDTARNYENETHVGAAIKESGIPRDQIFLTDKVFPVLNRTEVFNPALVRWAVEESLDRLDADYLDLLLLHWPNPRVPLEAALPAMTELRDDGWVRHIGVSNFPPGMLQRAIELAPIFCNQIEFHPFLSQTRVLEIARGHDLMVTAHTPLAAGLALTDATLQRIGARHGRSAPQIALRWLLDQPNVAVIPMAPRHDWRIENWQALDFALSAEERAEIDALSKDRRTVNPSFAPNWDA
ncbi:aldo/keto reductase [Candidatus Protofrankia californiensis]|uniref:aldo/keto reductase n=1 Tax=Candidatus Protofrankia californiensis TaxID=1839754 RepID=UPI0019D2BB9E|nr:aldo/keto reductase [Candidatus Protofrankia californiensis]